MVLADTIPRVRRPDGAYASAGKKRGHKPERVRALGWSEDRSSPAYLDFPPGLEGGSRGLSGSSKGTWCDVIASRSSATVCGWR